MVAVVAAALVWGGSGSGSAFADPAAAALPDAQVELVSRQLSGGPTNSESAGDTEVSGNGRWVLFSSDGAGLDPKVPTNPGIILPYLLDRHTGKVSMIATDSEGRVPELVIPNGGYVPNIRAKMSGDGRWVVMDNLPFGLLPAWVRGTKNPDETRLQFSLIKNLLNGSVSTVRTPVVTLNGEDRQPIGSPLSISRDGRWISYTIALAGRKDWSGLLITYGYLYDHLTGAWHRLYGPTDPTKVTGRWPIRMSENVRWLVTAEIPLDDSWPPTHRYRLVNLRTGAERLLPDNSSPELSRDGTRLFTTKGPPFPGKNLTLTVWDTASLKVLATRRIVDGKRPVASDGLGDRLLVNVPEYSGDPNLYIPGQLYVWDWAADVQTRVTRAMDGGRARLGASTTSLERVISDDGSVVVFASKAKNLVPGDHYDPFVSWDTFAALFAGPS